MTPTPPQPAKGLIIAAPASGHGKTVLTAALLRHLRSRGMAIGAFKTGPDYIDPGFHAAALGAPCINLDAWAMRSATLDRRVAHLANRTELIVGEGAMGLFDGSGDGRGATADIAARYGWPVVLAIDARRQGASVAALAEGFANHRADVEVCGVILNHVASARHERLLRMALDAARIPVLGAVFRDPALARPARHLGLIQATEAPPAALAAWLDGAAAAVEPAVDIDALLHAARPTRLEAAGATGEAITPLGSHVAIARDDAFGFCYPALLSDWQSAGAALSFFSPLADEAPSTAATAVYLPGGYPELHAGRLATNHKFMSGLQDAARRGATVYGECGGYMVLGRGLVDTDGAHHAMAGLLPLETSFADPALTLGHRMARTIDASPLGPRGTAYRGHEFHYCRVVAEEGDAALFTCRDSAGEAIGPAGLRSGQVMGSFVHVIDRAD